MSVQQASESNQHGRLAGHMALLATQACFGLFPLFGKLAFEAFDPFAVAGWRIVVGAGVLLALALAFHGRRALPRPGDLPRLGMCGLLGVVFNQVLFLSGLARSTAVNAGLLMPLIPVFTLLIAVAVRQERFSPARAIGIGIAFVGTVQLFLQREPDFSRPYLLGNVLIAINALSYSGFLVASRPLLQRYPPLVVIAWVYVLAVPTVPLFAGGVDWTPAAAGTREWLSLAYILAFPTVLAYLLNIFALARVSASTTAFYVYLQPVIAGLAGVLVLGEALRPGALLAAACIFVGLWFVVRGPSRPPAPRRPGSGVERRAGRA